MSGPVRRPAQVFQLLVPAVVEAEVRRARYSSWGLCGGLLVVGLLLASMVLAVCLLLAVCLGLGKERTITFIAKYFTY